MVRTKLTLLAIIAILSVLCLILLSYNLESLKECFYYAIGLIIIYINSINLLKIWDNE